MTSPLTGGRVSGLRQIRIVLLAVCVVVGINTAAHIRTFGTEREADDRLCSNQHSMVEMQRLFLEEHAALRADLNAAGVRSHSDPELLDRLARLIEAADCAK